VSALVRPALAGDDAAIAHVHVEGWRETYPGIVPARVLERLDIESRRLYWRSAIVNGRMAETVFVAEVDGTVAGFGVCGREQVGLRGYDGEFHALYLLRYAQGRGLGTRLMAAMARSLIERGMAAATVWALRDNWRARRFYEKLGGRLIADRPLDFDGTRVMEVAYGWTDVSPVARLAAPGVTGR
jgi:ribosomal protein S18 acetylase RimI-like enzyme